MRIVFLSVLVAAGVNGERVRELFRFGQLFGKLVSQRDLLFGIEVPQKREITADVEAPVGALEQVRRIPIASWLVLRPDGM